MENIVMGILAHVDAGKATLSEGILYLSGTVRKLGRVDHKDAFLDTYSLERDRGITIFSKQAIFSLGNRRINLLDTPDMLIFLPRWREHYRYLIMRYLLSVEQMVYRDIRKRCGSF